MDKLRAENEMLKKEREIEMPMKLGPITPEMEKAVAEAKLKEDAFFARHGFPDYSTSDVLGNTHPAHKEWVTIVEREGSAFDSPMSRKMFVLGWLRAGVR